MVDLSNNSLSNAIKIIEDWQPQDVKQAARTFPQEMYTSSAIYRWEQERIFGKAWYYVGHLSQLNGAGSFFTLRPFTGMSLQNSVLLSIDVLTTLSRVISLIGNNHYNILNCIIWRTICGS